MNKKFALLSLVAFLICALGGCQLAVEDGLETASDRLIGAFVTPEYLDLFDIEGYLNDNISSLPQNGELIVDGKDEQYNGRVYAVLKPQSSANGEEGSGEYEFNEIFGVPFFLAQTTQPDAESYLGISSSDMVGEVRISSGDDTAIEGTIYVAKNGPKEMYVNPVFQNGDGRVYLKAGTGVSMSGDTGDEEVFTQTLEEKQTVTENGVEKEQNFKVAIKITWKDTPENIGIIQMSAENTPLSRVDFCAGDVPETISIGQNTEYIIVETKISPDGEKIVREIYTPADEYLTNFTVGEHGIFEVGTASLLWAES